MNEFVKRSLSGALYVAVIIWIVLYHDFSMLAGVLACLAVREYNGLISKRRSLVQFISEIASLLPFIALAVYDCGIGIVTILLVIYALAMIGVLLMELWDTDNKPFEVWGHILISHVMIVLPFVCMSLLQGIDKWLLLATFVLIWVNDSGAYCVGCLTAKLPKGNHKMFVRVSPKKSWEGLIGGIVFSVVASMLLAHFGWFDTLGENINVYIAGGIFAVLVSGFGTLGDLVESLMKRTIGVKDSGKFLPGHGGILDRFDSILLAAPIVLIFVIILSIL